MKQRPDETETTYDPYIAAGLLVDKMDGTQFMGRTLRLDRVGRPRGKDPNSGDGSSIALERDPAVTIFVGNLDFAAKEEDVRAFFETLLTVEIGPPRTENSKNVEHGDEEESAGASSDEEEGDSSSSSIRKDDRKGKSQDQGADDEDDDGNNRDNNENEMDIDSENKIRWVRSVRIIRDKDTQLGKGFAYVRFSVSFRFFFCFLLFFGPFFTRPHR